MALELKRAQRKKAFLKMGMSAPSGGGKTLGALLIAYGLMKEKYPKLPDNEIWPKIAIIDTENGSGELYVGREEANVKIGEYLAVTLTPPFEAKKYIDAIRLCGEGGVEVCIIDSTTHLWSGEGGLLQKQGEIAKRSGNSYTAWRDVTPDHNRFVDAMLQSPMHVIATIRSKIEYVQEKDSDGHTTVRKLGLEPVQRSGMEYEFTMFLEINAEHQAFGSKDRTGLVDQKTFVITPEIGRKIMKWLDGGTEAETVVVATEKEKKPVIEQQEDEETDEKKIHAYKLDVKKLYESADEPLQVKYKELFAQFGNPNNITDPAKLAELIQKMKETK